MTPRFEKSCALLALVAIVAIAVHAEEVDPTQLASKTIPLAKTDQPEDLTAPPSRVLITDGEELWQAARERVGHPGTGQGSGFFDATTLTGDDFRSAEKFYAERYEETESGSRLKTIIAADVAVKDGEKIILDHMRMIYFISDDPPAAQDTKPTKGAKSTASSSAPMATTTASKTTPPTAPLAVSQPSTEKAKTSAAPSSMSNLFLGGRMVISAPHAVIDSNTNEARATGTATIEIFGAEKPGSPGSNKNAIAKLTSDKLRWRTWNEPSTGSTELALYTSTEDPRDDPLVTGEFVLPQPDGNPSSIYIKGFGMIFEVGDFDRLTAVPDESERMAGLTLKERNRALFHRGITMVSTTSSAGMLLQVGKASQTSVNTASKTIITCHGPALLDMCVVPPKMDDSPLQSIDMQRRFQFYNQVHLTKRPVEEKPQAGVMPAEPTEMTCGQLCLEYPPGVTPTPGQLPQIAEAVGGVSMHGVSEASTAPAGNQATGLPAGPFLIECDRIYHDELRDNMFLVGSKNKPARVKNGDGEAIAQQLNYRQKTEQFTMPSIGPKTLIMHSANMAANAKPGDLNVSGDTTIKWEGLLTRELRHIPVPRAPDRIKEVMTFNKNVVIDQPGMRLSGQTVHVVRDEFQQVEFLEGSGSATIVTGAGEHLDGDVLSVKILPADVEKKLPSANVITVVGNRSEQIKATLRKPDSALSADKFVIDERADTFHAYGGAVAVFKGPVKPDAPSASAPDSGKAIFKSIKFEPGGDLTLQCDGEFFKDGATHQVILQKNVIVRQPNLQLFADDVRFTLEGPTAPVGKPQVNNENPAQTSAEIKTRADAKGLFSGDLKSMDCQGEVELVNENQWVQCDHLYYDATTEVSLLKVDDPDNDVRIYLRQEDGSTKIMSVKSSLNVDGKAGVYTPGGVMFMLPYRAASPAARDKESSPAHLRAPVPVQNVPAPEKSKSDKPTKN